MDVVEITAERHEKMMQEAEARIRQRANKMPIGEAGDCDQCGEPSRRLIDGICCPCRDRLERYRQRLGKL